MSLRNMQDDVDKWAGQFTPKYWPPLEQMTRLAEETGEVAREMNNLHGTKKRKPEEKEGNLAALVKNARRHIRIFSYLLDCFIMSSKNIMSFKEHKFAPAQEWSRRFFISVGADARLISFIGKILVASNPQGVKRVNLCFSSRS